jgi:hypothetical protein
VAFGHRPHREAEQGAFQAPAAFRPHPHTELSFWYPSRRMVYRWKTKVTCLFSLNDE